MVNSGCLVGGMLRGRDYRESRWRRGRGVRSGLTGVENGCDEE